MVTCQSLQFVGEISVGKGNTKLKEFNCDSQSHLDVSFIRYLGYYDLYNLFLDMNLSF